MGDFQPIGVDNKDACFNAGDSSVEVPSINANYKKKLSFFTKNNLDRYLRTGALFYSWICLGLYAEVLGPSLPSFMSSTSSSYEQIGKVLSIREAGMFFGSLLGAFAADCFSSHRTGTIAITQFLGALTIGVVPLCKHFWTLSVTLFFSGFAHGALTSNGNPLLGAIWGQNADGPFNFMHSGYGVGGALAPVLLSPFSYLSNFSLPKAFNRHLKIIDSNNSRGTVLVHLVQPCSIIASMCSLAAIFFLMFEFTDHFNRIRSPSTANDTDVVELNEYCPKSNSSKRSFMRTQLKRICNFITSQKSTCIMLPFIFALYFALVGNERVFAKFLYISAVEGPTKFTSADSYLLNTIYWVVFCLARILTVVVSLKLSIFLLFGVQLVGTLAMAAGLLFAPPTHGYFFTFTGLFGLFKSPLFPTGLSVINKTIELSGLIVFFVNLGSSIGASCLQYLASYLIELYSPSVFTLTVTVTAGFLLVVGMGLLFTSLFIRRRSAERIKINGTIDSVSYHEEKF